MAQAASHCDIKAFIPHASVFVAANAGAGKTSLLTNRVLSLLLSGTELSRILCLTFTKAAAAEMATRIQKELGKWVMMEESALSKILTELLGVPADRQKVAYARSLFAKVLESPEGARIQTIHGFCQSLLRRFPLEAGISPHFTVMDNRTEAEMLREARMRLFGRAQKWGGRLQHAIGLLATDASESVFHDLLSEITRNKRKFYQLVQTSHDLEESLARIWKLSGLRADITEADLIHEHFTYADATLVSLKKIASLLVEGAKTDKRTGKGLAQWLSMGEKTPEAAARYCETYFTTTGKPYDQIYTKASLPDAALAEILNAEFTNVRAFHEKLRSLAITKRSSAMMVVAHALLELYATLKRNSARMDYDDLILTAISLLKRQEFAAWVLYKLDGGIDHILVDEAQDTSPEQWEIVKALTEEFFAGKGRSQANRSLFVVGDEKQSIYRFQGADVHALKTMQDYFFRRIQDSGETAYRQSLIKSYRSLPAVLQAVDSIFANPAIRQNIMQEDSPLAHMAHREDSTGLVELWPLIGKEENERVHSSSRMIRQITDQIGSWLENGMMLESKGRPIEAGDIMILVRKRTNFVDRLSRSLKRRRIPVAGIDRMVLGDNLAVQDLIALGQFLLLPGDDLTLACVLKSPIGNLSEDALFQLAHGRGAASLWERLEAMASEDKELAGVHALLKDLRARVDYVAPYELYIYLLESCGMRRRFIGRMGSEYNDPIDEFLSQALLFERSHPPSMQGFLHWLNNSESEIKRDMEEARGMVRIMTVHGAKGLEAPIVILPDTTETPTVKDKILWHQDSGTPFWPGKVSENSDLCARMRSAEEAALYAEYCRQLYVAMTRARDCLFICGATEKNLKEGSWYHLIQQGLAAIAIASQTEYGTNLRLGKELVAGDVRMPARKELSPEMVAGDTLAFLGKATPVEPNPTKPLTPSKMKDDTPSSFFPMDERLLYSRGKLIHALLQHLPNHPQAKHDEIATHVAAGYHTSMTAAERESCIRESLGILDHPQYGFLFEGGLAEVPIAGTVNIGGIPYTVSGQIDRLHIAEDVWVIDYKTGRNIPPDARQTPLPYLRQMALYRHLLAAMYPTKAIHCGLLWTAAPTLMKIPEALLDEVTFGS